MTSKSISVSALNAKTKSKPGFRYEEVSANEKLPGSSDRDLGRQWGLAPERVNQSGRTTRQGSRSQPIPGGLDSAQEERPPYSIHDPPEGSGTDRMKDQNHPSNLGVDRSVDRSQDRSGRPDSNQLETDSQEDRRLSYAPSEEPVRISPERQSTVVPPSERETPAFQQSERMSSEDPQMGISDPHAPDLARSESRSSEGTQRPEGNEQRSVRSDADEVEQDLLGTGANSEYNDRPSNHIQNQYDDEDNKDFVNVPDEYSSLEEILRRRKSSKRRHRRHSRKRRERRERKAPRRPSGYEGAMTSISMVRRNETVSRHQRLKAPTSVSFGAGNNIPLGMRFAKERKGGNGSDPSESSEDESLSDRGQKKSRRRRDSTSSGSTTPSDSSSSDSSEPSSASSDSSYRDRRHRRKSKSKRKNKKRSKKRRRETKAEREERRALARQKLDPPSTYDGKADLTVFDKWTYEVDTWVRMSKYREPTALNLLVKCVTGKASEFFMNFVAGNEDSWTIREMYEALFDHCFPSDIKDRLRSQLSNATQGKRRIREFVREIEKLASWFPDVNERTIIQTFWSGMHQHIRLRLIEWGISPEDTPLEQIVRKAMDIEKRDEAYSREQRAGKPDPPKREWGRFANRKTGPQPYRPSEEGGSSSRKTDRVRANAATPQNSNGESHSKDPRQHRRGRKIGREKRDELRAAGKCFHCEEHGHSQRDCPKLNTYVRRPTANAASIEDARKERLTRIKGSDEIHVGLLGIRSFTEEIDDVTDAERRAYDLCALEWGPDERWLRPWTRVDSHYMIYQYETIAGEIIEIRDERHPEMGALDIAASRLDDPEFRLSDVYLANANTGSACIQKGGWYLWTRYQRRRHQYKKWEWSGINDLKSIMNSQRLCERERMGTEMSAEPVKVWPAMDGYCIHLENTDVFYGIKHAEVLADSFNPKRIIDQMVAMIPVPPGTRPSIFRDTALNRRQSIMTNAVKLMVGVSRARKGTKRTEGVQPIERTSMRPKDQARKIPEPIVVLAKIDGHQIRALLDTGSMADFLSTTVVDQLELRREYYSKPLSVQLAVHGSRSKINCGVRVNLQYQNIDCERRFDVANLDNYDAILGTPFLFQHKVAIGINPSCVVVGSNAPVEIEGPDIVTISSAAADVLNEKMDKQRVILRKEAEDLCADPSKTALPPFRAVNHTIPLIDERKVYRFRRSTCPEAFRDQWREKKDTYIVTGRWRVATGHNAIPMLMIPKVSSSGGKPGLRTVFDKREQNANTYKLASPLPDIEEILREVSRHKFRSLIDGKDAYEQIRVIPEHVPRTLFTTPDGTMESLVMQQGDCNAGATYQTLMNHIFASHIGVFMFVYLDDIIVFSDTIEDHVRHVKMVLDILRKERLFLSPNKMQFFAEELKILGHVINEKGIRMDPHKVDKVLNWKTPTNKDLLRSFIGAVGFLAPNCKSIRIPMGHLSSLTAEPRPWRWDSTAQRSFDKVKWIVNEHRDLHRKALNYAPGAPPIYVTTDGCLTGGGGYVSQGEKPENAGVVAFWSGKWNAAQQNYPVHEQELLALVETLKRFRGILHGTQFTLRTDHKALEYFMSQEHFSPRQHRWIDVLSEFDFTIQYIPGETNKFADALSRIYSDEPKGVVRADSEFVDEGNEAAPKTNLRIRPIYVESHLLELLNAVTRKSSRLAEKPSPRYKETRDRRKSRDRSGEPEEGMRNEDVPMSSIKEVSPESPERLETETRLKETMLPENRLLEVASELGISFPECIRNRYKEDKFFLPILENPEEFTNFSVRNGLVLFVSEGSETIAVPDVRESEQSIREVLIRQAHSILAHLSDEKTVTYMRDQVWWKTMVNDVTAYCKTCQTCAISKPGHGKPHGKLKTMPVPKYPWQYVGLDFVGPLPGSSNRMGEFDMICVIIDILTSMVHLVPSKQTYRATDIAELMFENVYKLHGIPERLISDRDSLFTSKFWKRLHTLVGTQLRMSSVFHPQTDGATERANRTITQITSGRPYCK